MNAYKYKIVLFVSVISLLFTAVLSAGDYGVYEYILQKTEGSVGDVSKAVVSKALKDGWKVLSTSETGGPEGCTYKAHVIILYDSVYAEKVLKANAITGYFAIVDRVNIFEDEAGVHISVVNPHSINRTVLMDDMKYESISQDQLAKLRTMIESAVEGQKSNKQYGQIRDEGYISKTMGVMAGGLFKDKIENIEEIPAASVKDIATKVSSGLSNPGQEWGLQKVFKLELPQYNTVVFGITSSKMEAKSFNIVRSGSDKSRKNYQCPGLAHAAAYPFHVIVTKSENSVKIRMVTSMFRMKMFFEDAGKWAFMKNMTMPGSLSGEVEDLIRTGLNSQ